jgi:CheY-like chemotaxis protein
MSVLPLQASDPFPEPGNTILMEGSLGLTKKVSSIQDIRAPMQGHGQQVATIRSAPMQSDRKPRVLIVEDEAMVSMLIEDMVGDLGAEVMGPAARFEQAMTLALEAHFDLAVLDVNLDGLAVYPIADVLRDRGIPFIFITGYDSSVVPESYQPNRVLSKPFAHPTFCEALGEALPDLRTEFAGM